MASKFFVGGLDPQTTRESMHAYFSSFGRMTDCVVMFKEGRPRCFGFVTFDDSVALPEDFAGLAHVIDGKQVEVKAAVPSQAVAATTSKLFVGGLAPTTDTDQMVAYFSQFGTVTDAVAINAHGQPRGFGFVTFSTPDEAAAVLATTGHVIEGKAVELKSAQPKGSPLLSVRIPFGRNFFPQAAGGFFGGPRAYGGLQYAAPQLPGQYNPYPAFATRQPTGAPASKLFVGGLSPVTNEDTLFAYFSNFGTVTQSEIMRRPDESSRGFGFVAFASPHEAAAAVAAQYHELDGRVVEVKQCLPKGVAPPVHGLMRGYQTGAMGMAGPQLGLPQQAYHLAQNRGMFQRRPFSPLAMRYRPY
jgi:RNA recognition motif-containing protein